MDNQVNTRVTKKNTTKAFLVLKIRTIDFRENEAGWIKRFL